MASTLRPGYRAAGNRPKKGNGWNGMGNLEKMSPRMGSSLRKPLLYSAATRLSVASQDFWATDEHGAAQPQPNLRSVALLIKMFVIEADILKRSATRSEEHTSELQSLRHLVC